MYIQFIIYLFSYSYLSMYMYSTKNHFQAQDPTLAPRCNGDQKQQAFSEAKPPDPDRLLRRQDLPMNGYPWS